MNTPTHITYFGRVLLIDKPLHWTSFDVIKKIRNIIKVKKVGHAGTLDPLATGLLIVCTGNKTKQIKQFMELEKEYTGTMVLGKTTPSVDLETEFDSEHDWHHITEQKCRNTTSQFLGEIEQKPPVYSAIKVDGIRAYEKARQGQKITMKNRLVKVTEFQLTSVLLPEIVFRIKCSKGTYIRSLVRDFGEKLGVGAYLANLRRTKIGDYNVENALTIDQVQNNEDLPRTSRFCTHPQCSCNHRYV